MQARLNLQSTLTEGYKKKKKTPLDPFIMISVSKTNIELR